MSESFFYTSKDGLRLHARIHGSASPVGAESPLPVVCLPGLTRNARDFAELAGVLATAGHRVVCFDYRGRGLSDRDPNWRNYDLVVEAGDVMAGLAALAIDRAAFIGTSRGGLIIHVLAAMRPALIAAAVLNDIGPRIEAEGLRLIRNYLADAPRPASFAEAVALQKTANGDAFSALTETDWDRMVRAVHVQEQEPPVPAYDPALLRTLEGVDLDQPLPELWPQFSALASVPVMAIRGRNSRLLSASTLTEMQVLHPGLVAVTVDGQGHAPLLETGDLPERIAGFLAAAHS